jgi:hypothetical protein
MPSPEFSCEQPNNVEDPSQCGKCQDNLVMPVDFMPVDDNQNLIICYCPNCCDTFAIFQTGDEFDSFEEKVWKGENLIQKDLAALLASRTIDLDFFNRG